MPMMPSSVTTAVLLALTSLLGSRVANGQAPLISKLYPGLVEMHDEVRYLSFTKPTRKYHAMLLITDESSRVEKGKDSADSRKHGKVCKQCWVLYERFWAALKNHDHVETGIYQNTKQEHLVTGHVDAGSVHGKRIARELQIKDTPTICWLKASSQVCEDISDSVNSAVSKFMPLKLPRSLLMQVQVFAVSAVAIFVALSIWERRERVIDSALSVIAVFTLALGASGLVYSIREGVPFFIPAGRTTRGPIGTFQRLIPAFSEYGAYQLAGNGACIALCNVVASYLLLKLLNKQSYKQSSKTKTGQTLLLTILTILFLYLSTSLTLKARPNLLEWRFTRGITG